VSQDFVERHKLRIKDAFTTIEMIVRTSPLNIAMVGTLSHGEYYISDPLRNEVTKRNHLTPQQAGECMGTFSMACIVQAGHAYYNTTLVNDLPPLSKHAGRKSKKEKSSDTVQEDNDDDDDDNDISQPCENYIDSLIRNLPNFTTQRRLPKLEDIQQFLKKAFTSLDQSDHYFLQSILPDLYVLQPWTRPLDNDEEKTLRSLNHQQQKKTVDSTHTNEEDELFGGFGLDSLKFNGLNSVKGKQAINNVRKQRTSQGQMQEDAEKDTDDMDMEVSGDALTTSASSILSSTTKNQSSNSKKQSTSADRVRRNMSTVSQHETIINNNESGKYLPLKKNLFLHLKTTLLNNNFHYNIQKSGKYILHLPYIHSYSYTK